MWPETDVGSEPLASHPDIRERDEGGQEKEIDEGGQEKETDEGGQEKETDEGGQEKETDEGGQEKEKGTKRKRLMKRAKRKRLSEERLLTAFNSNAFCHTDPDHTVNTWCLSNCVRGLFCIKTTRFIFLLCICTPWLPS